VNVRHSRASNSRTTHDVDDSETTTPQRPVSPIVATDVHEPGWHTSTNEPAITTGHTRRQRQVTTHSIDASAATTPTRIDDVLGREAHLAVECTRHESTVVDTHRGSQ
jgi:hypothetical protein